MPAQVNQSLAWVGGKAASNATGSNRGNSFMRVCYFRCTPWRCHTPQPLLQSGSGARSSQLKPTLRRTPSLREARISRTSAEAGKPWCRWVINDRQEKFGGSHQRLLVVERVDRSVVGLNVHQQLLGMGMTPVPLRISISTPDAILQPQPPPFERLVSRSWVAAGWVRVDAMGRRPGGHQRYTAAVPGNPARACNRWRCSEARSNKGDRASHCACSLASEPSG